MTINNKKSVLFFNRKSEHLDKIAALHTLPILYWCIILLLFTHNTLAQDTLSINPIKDTIAITIPNDTIIDTSHTPVLRYNPKHALRWSLLPGAGQIYNQQYWKAPIFMGAFAGALTMTIKRKVDYNNYYDQYATELLNSGMGNATLNAEALTALRKDKQNALRDYNRWRMATATVYGIGLLDAYLSAHIRNDIKTHSPIKAAYYSAILPGLGQAYNKKYWKIPLVYAGFAATGYFMYVNGKGMQLYTKEYLVRTRPGYGDANPDLVLYSDDTLLKIRGLYKRYYEISIIAASLWYLLNILDATTDAYLHDFDISDDLSWHVQPYLNTIGDNSSRYLPNATTTYSGITWVWNF